MARESLVALKLPTAIVNYNECRYGTPTGTSTTDTTATTTMMTDDIDDDNNRQ